ncbi:MAG TPA: sugar phosphate isomerase/epimerase [Sphingopyxis sp.]|nr:sugar phosphate isomerase/epimerase [Sphingopyxis sp.]
MIERRQFLAAAAATAMLPKRAIAAPAKPIIGFQLYMARELLAKDFEATLTAIAATGVRHVEFAGFYDRDAAAIRKTLADNGLIAIGAHAVRADMDDAEIDRLIEQCAAIGMEYVVAPVPLVPAYRALVGKSDNPFRDAIAALTRDDFLRTADRFNAIGGKVQNAGMRFAYHTHGLDFLRFDGRYAFDDMIDRCDPALVAFELDIGNTIAAGVDPLPYLERLGRRAALAHLKDWQGPIEPAVDRVPPTAPIGEGIVDLKATMRAMTAAGVRYAFIEEEETPAGRVIAAIGSAYRHLSRL